MTNPLLPIFQAVNSGQRLPDVLNTEPQEVRRHHALSIALINLRQRFNSGQAGSQLVERLRVEVVERVRPVRDIRRDDEALDEYAQRMVQLAPRHETFSAFQVEGWEAMRKTIHDRSALVLLAPTGSGKTEVFLLPIVDDVASSLTDAAPAGAGRHFLLIYPRVELLRDQLSRLLVAVHHAQQSLFEGEARILVGMQFSGIKSSLKDTLDERQVFSPDLHFKKISSCPVCKTGQLQYQKHGVEDHLVCTESTCDGNWWVSIAKETHKTRSPHLMVATAEALDRFYLDPLFNTYLQSIDGLALDEAHLYYGVYGAHIHNVFKRFSDLRRGRPLARIASSATIVEPEQFVAKLLNIVPPEVVQVHDASNSRMEPSGNEYAYFIQARDDAKSGITRQNPALIQTIMLLGHGFLNREERIVAFVDSVDQTDRFRKTISDADNTRHLWWFRVRRDDIHYNGHDACHNPERCEIFKNGECWRAINSASCHLAVPGLRDTDLHINQVSRNHQNDFLVGDVVIATPILEVGIDDERIAATVHYQAPVSGVHGFIQRRGRAGRKAGSDAYTVMVLGQSPTEQYYFYRRHRLLHGKYMLPLNPENPVIAEIHALLARARTDIVRRMGRSERVQRPLHTWIIDTLRGCRLLQELYPADLEALEPGQGFGTQLRQWRGREQPALRDRLQLRAMIRELREDVPKDDRLSELANEALRQVDEFEHGRITREQIRETLTDISDLLTRMIYRDTEIAGVQVRAYRDQFERLWEALDRPGDPRSQFSEQLYDFFETLQKFEEAWKLNSIPDAIKIILQALYFLHLGPVQQHEGTCPSDPHVLVPDAYFGETKLVVIEARSSARAFERPVKTPENISFLSSLLLPYALTSRYFKSGDFLGTLDTAPRGIATLGADGVPEVHLDLNGQGIDRGSLFEPQKVQVRRIRPSTEGTDAIKMCPTCYRLYDITRTTPCHEDPLIPVKVFPTPLRHQDYRETQAAIPFSTQFSLAEQLRADTIVEGSEVSYSRCFGEPEGEGFRYTVMQQRSSFRALYDKPLGYGLSTTGILWNADRMVIELMSNATLKEQVESVSIGSVRQNFDETLILNTAGNMLIRAIVAIAGVNAGNLGLKVHPEQRELCVWETIEGGTGISQVFMQILRTTPVEVYQEFLATALCSVNQAEQDPLLSRSALEAKLMRDWFFPVGSSQLTDLLNDVTSEQAAIAASGDAHTLTCSLNDGCPACVQSNERSKGRAGEENTSHFVAVAIARYLVKKMDRTTLEAAMVRASGEGMVLPQQLTAQDAQGQMDVLVL